MAINSYPIQPIQPVQIGVPPAPQGPVGPVPQAEPKAVRDRDESDSRHDLEHGNVNGSRRQRDLEDEFQDDDASHLPELKDEIADRNVSHPRRSRDIEDELANTEELNGHRSGRAPRASRNGGSNGRNGSAESEPASERTNGRSKAAGPNGKARPRVEANGSRRARPSQVEENEWEMDDYVDHDEDDVLHGVEDSSRSARPGLNINLISGLVRWVSNVQDLLGDAGMEEMVDLYFKTTKDSPGTRELISRIADTLPYAETSRVDPRSEQSIAEQWMDMLIQLHGVLNWDCVPPDIPGLGLSKPSED